MSDLQQAIVTLEETRHTAEKLGLDGFSRICNATLRRVRRWERKVSA